MSEIKDVTAMCNILEEQIGVPEEVINVVCKINGYNESTMKDILYVYTGYGHFGLELFN